MKGSSLHNRSITHIIDQAKVFSGVRWAPKGLLALVDQMTFSGSSFVLNLILARWLPPDDYGIFALSYSVFFLVGSFHNAILSEPMLVFGAGRFKKSFRGYLTALLCIHLVIAGLISVMLLFLAVGLAIRGHMRVATAFAGLAVGSPAILALWLTRRALYVTLRPDVTAVGAGGYLALLLLFLVGAHSYFGLTPARVFIGLGVVSSFVTVFYLIWLSPDWKDLRSRNIRMRPVLSAHWQYGRWSVGAILVKWVPGNIYYVMLPAYVGLEGTAAFKAMMNFLAPMGMIFSSLGLLLIPLVTRSISTPGRKPKPIDLVLLVMAVFVPWALAYALILAASPRQLISMIYGGNYAEVAGLVRVMGFSQVVNAMTLSMALVLKSVENPKPVFFSYFVSTLVTCLLIRPMLMAYGLAGVVVVLYAATFSSFFVTLLFAKKELKERIV